MVRKSTAVGRSPHGVAHPRVIAGWDVPHFHYHVIPMFDYDDLDPQRARQFPAAECRAMADRLAAAVARLTRDA